MRHYVIISADCHAGPVSPVYRGYLDARFHGDFDDELAERQRIIDDRRAGVVASPFVGDDEFQKEWFGEDEEATASTRSACEVAGPPPSATRSSTTTV